MHYQHVEKENNSNVSAFIEKMGGFTAVRNTPLVDGRIRSTVVSTPDGDSTSN